MKYKQFVYTALFTIITTLNFTAGDDELSESRKFHNEKFSHESKLEKIVSMWNKNSFSTENPAQLTPQRAHPLNESQNDSEKPLRQNEFFESEAFTQNFPTELSQCIGNHQYQITENYNQGKNIILNCFKAALILNIGKYLVASPKSSIQLFNGLLELKKIPDKSCSENGDTPKCSNKYSRFFERLTNSQNKKNEYIKMYKRAMEKLINENSKFKSYRNQTEEQRIVQLNRINEGSQAFLSEIIRNINNEEAEKKEEENLKRELTDPKLLAVLDAFSKNYMLKLNLYPGISARMMRSQNTGVTFDLELNESSEEEEAEEEIPSDEVSTREIKSSRTKGKDFMDDDDEGGGGNKKRKKMKKRKKEAKKKVKKLKKVIPYLLLPMLIQATLLPFVFKKLFFLAMKALFAGKVALILVGFNLLRNTCIKGEGEDKYAQRIRVEHYGYKGGQEYGAWVNGRSIQEPEMMSALSEEPFRGQKPAES